MSGDFLTLQRQFAAHVRDPHAQPAPGDVDARRMAVYRELIHNGLGRHLAEGFPVIRRLHSDAQWHDLVRDFLIHHRCTTPLFTRLGQEFVTFLATSRDAPDDPPFLAELAHYEQLEVDVAFAEDGEDDVDLTTDGDPIDGHPVLASTARVVRYRFPVHRIGPGHQPTTAPDDATHLIVYRDPQAHVRFMEINALSHGLLQCIAAKPEWTGRDAALAVAAAIAHPDPDTVVTAARPLLAGLRDRGILRGTRAGPR